MDQHEAAGNVIRIEHAKKALQPLGRHARTDLHADGVTDTAEELDVRTVELAGTHADPRAVGGQVVPLLPVFQEAGLRLLVGRVRAFVTV